VGIDTVFREKRLLRRLDRKLYTKIKQGAAAALRSINRQTELERGYVMKTISATGLRELKRRAANLRIINVLPEDQYRKCHILGSQNVPLADKDFVRRVREMVTSADEIVIVHSFNKGCDLSRKAVQKLEKCGFDHVIDYEGGIEDWLRNGLPVESYVHVRTTT
jgi:rhodanese-related sulfurtransferase